MLCGAANNVAYLTGCIMKKLNRAIFSTLVIGAGIFYYVKNNSGVANKPDATPAAAITYHYKVEQVIKNGVYTSYFSYALHEPLYVAYKLYQGGGDCSRKHMHFKTDNIANSATIEDYKHSLFDEGHLCPAEDEAFDCGREEQTFRYYNCLPQTPKLNRGIWKVWETQVRAESQTDSLLILCGGIYGDKKIGDAAVPDYCWKLVYGLSSRRIMHCLIFPNDDSNTAERISIDELKQKVGYPLVLPF